MPTRKKKKIVIACICLPFLLILMLVSYYSIEDFLFMNKVKNSDHIEVSTIYIIRKVIDNLDTTNYSQEKKKALKEIKRTVNNKANDSLNDIQLEKLIDSIWTRLYQGN